MLQQLSWVLSHPKDAALYGGLIFSSAFCLFWTLLPEKERRRR